MVKKLFKHEIKAYLRVMLPVYICLLLVALLGRAIQFFEVDSTIYDLVNGSSIFVYVISIIACFGFSTFFSVVRFYKNLFTGEGYLTFTLPVTPTEHLWVKLLTSLLFNIFSFVCVIISLMIMTAGDVFKEVTKAMLFLFDYAISQIGFASGLHTFFYLIEILVLVILVVCYEILIYYACIAIGQLSKKNKVLCAVAVYFAYYFITQIVSTVLVIVLVLVANSPLIMDISDFMVVHPVAFMHIVLCSSIVFTAVLSFVFFYITRKIMTTKLNLE